MFVLDSPMLEAVVASLGWTLLHFLWQGAVVGVLFGLALATASQGAARTRYRIALASMLVLAVCPVATFIWLLPQAPIPSVLAATIVVPAAEAVLDSAGASPMDWRAIVDPWVPWTVLAWALGVVLYTCRLLLEWRDIRRLSRMDIEPLPDDWEERVSRLTRKLGVHRVVTVLQSTRVQVPLVVGFFKPLILVPVTAFTGLTPWQLELILMHELAHIRRHDYLVNLLQVVVETLLFYHPVVRWVSRVAREEREHCCDDLVVARSGDALSYARALTELAGAQSMGLQTSVGSDGGKLLSRIKRIVASREPTRVSTHWSVGMMLAVLAVSVSSLLQPSVDSDVNDEVVHPVAAMPVAPVAANALPAFGSLRDIVSAIPELPREESQPPEDIPSTTSEAGQGSVSAPVESTAGIDAAVALEAAEEGGSAPRLRHSLAQLEVEPIVADPLMSIPRVVPSVPAADPEPEMATGSAMPPQDHAAAAPPAARRISFRAPEFPQDARLVGIEGWVRFTYTINRNGNVSDVRILEAQPRHVFENAVRRAVRQWKFEPIMQDGRAVERDVTQTIEFALGRAVDEGLGARTCEPGTGTRLCRNESPEPDRQGSTGNRAGFAGEG